jgi:hypothetical protein
MHARGRIIEACTEAAGYNYTFHAFCGYNCTIVFTNLGRRMFQNHPAHWDFFRVATRS